MATDTKKTEVGSYFISNYPPFSQWTAEGLVDVRSAMEHPPHDVPLGLYLHIPFCRKRCKFCYFRVYTDRNASQIEQYMSALANEVALLAGLPVRGDRPLRFVYFGGGTPSYPSSKQLARLVERLEKSVHWDTAEEVTFECEPGTLSEEKVSSLKHLGVTRLSLGVENFSDAVLRENGRAHLSREIYQAWDWIAATDFPNVNIDLIAGMVGETWDNWKQCVHKTIDMAPDSVTIYQMELPYNTVYSSDMLEGNMENPVADWPTKRAWTNYAFDQLVASGYSVSSAYTLVKDSRHVHFRYRDHLWEGCDLLAAGVASFGHVSGVHYQNMPDWNGYIEPVQRGELPLSRGMRPTPHQLLVRELILQMKRGGISADYFSAKFGRDVLHDWSDVWEDFQRRGFVSIQDRSVVLTRNGLLRADGLLPAFFEEEHQGIRYT